jgi:hypothetical protein
MLELTIGLAVILVVRFLRALRDRVTALEASRPTRLEVFQSLEDFGQGMEGRRTLDRIFQAVAQAKEPKP